jgi:hypothetical protein
MGFGAGGKVNFSSSKRWSGESVDIAKFDLS